MGLGLASKARRLDAVPSGMAPALTESQAAGGAGDAVTGTGDTSTPSSSTSPSTAISSEACSSTNATNVNTSGTEASFKVPDSPLAIPSCSGIVTPKSKRKNGQHPNNNASTSTASTSTASSSASSSATSSTANTTTSPTVETPPTAVQDVESLIKSLGQELFQVFKDNDLWNEIQKTEDPLDERLSNIKKRQFELERQAERLTRRFKLIQARQIGDQVAEEALNVLSLGSKINEIQKEPQSATSNSANAVSRRHPGRYFGTGSSNNSSKKKSITPQTTPTTKPEIVEKCLKAKEVASQLECQLHVLERELDSDATASSSGAESCDEMLNYNNTQQLTAPLQRRAAYRWAEARAGIAARWMWLQAQISDLEYRIRQHGEIHRQIRAAKGAVTLHGFEGPLPGECSRAAPLERSSFRKRKLLQTAGLHLISKRAAKPSSVRCLCSRGQVCALCTGRPDPTAFASAHILAAATAGAPPEPRTISERLALLDPSFHPVLSFPDDASQTVHMEALMQTTEFQQRAIRVANMTPIASSTVSLEKPGRKGRRLKNGSAPATVPIVNNQINVAARIKKKLAKGRKTSTVLHRLNKRKGPRKTHHSSSTMGADSLVENSSGLPTVTTQGFLESGSGPGSKHVSPAPSPPPITSHYLHQNTGKESVSFRRKRENSYDIDNIVIPYSIASATRLERLPYKEILTPKWRLAPDPSGSIESLEPTGEDLSEETISVRHDRCEQDEKKKFLSFIKLPQRVGGGGNRGSRRADSRAESSGANTPDPLSPMPHDSSSAIASSVHLTTPNDCNLPVINEKPRRRTVSQTRTSPERDYPLISSTELPWEPRLFPLSDETYVKMTLDMPEDHPFSTPTYMPAPTPTPTLIPIPIPTPTPTSTPNPKIRSTSPAIVSDSTDSAPGEEAEEDPNDPEWTNR